METLEKKITLATFKSFVKKNKDNLFIDVKSSFDGMIDCVTPVKALPSKIAPDKIDLSNKHTLGIVGVWLVGSSRDYFTAFEDEICKGISVSNCCGSFTLTTLK